VSRSPLDLLVPVVMYGAMLVWLSRRISWTQRLAIAAVTLAVIVCVLLFERGF
jgi:hypothetical protein